ncbi:MAG TPA: SufD family Fe-S cluster assembly protein [Steroidobacteraceae bacterium]|nr:SufD family Fe-S cluster assembly protein [Steroidobacteraceae bacterium]
MSQPVRAASHDTSHDASRGASRGAALERALRDFEALAAQLPEQVVPRVVRRRAAEQLARLGWPQARDEQWRYANLRALERIERFAPAAGPAAGAASDAGAAAAAAATLELPPALPGFERLLFVDGVRVAPTGGPGSPVTLSAARATEPCWGPEQRLGLLGDMFAQDAAVLTVAGEASVEVVFVSSARAGGAGVYPRLLLELAPGSRLTLVERHLGAPSATTLLSATVTAELARAAQLTHYRLQQCGAQVLFNDTLSVRLQEQACYRVRQIGTGAHSARTSARVRLAGRGASLSWQAIALGRGEQVHDTTLTVEHAAAATRTEESFRGIADERARLAFSAHIHIESAAAGAEARQSLRGLIEGTSAEIDLRPRLQIDTDEVSAQHGATTGRLDDNLLFYLLARGIDRASARALLKWAFLGDVLRSIELPALRVQAERDAAGQLQEVLALGAVLAEQAAHGGGAGSGAP